MTKRDLERMAQELADGTLGEIEFTLLQEELRANAESREFFRRSMEVEMLLVEAMGRHTLIGGARREQIVHFMHRRKRKDQVRALLATAAILVIAGVIMSLVHISRPDPAALAITPVPGADWRVEGGSNAPNQDTRKAMEGSTVIVQSGTLKLELESGLVMLLRGPAEASFPKVTRPVLKRGWLWIDSGASSEPIEVETPQLRVRDIGTRFGVRVREDGLAEIHLASGLLELVSKNGGRKNMTIKPEGKGLFLPASGEPSELPLEPDPFPSLAELLASATDYRTALLGQGPLGYWRLEDSSGNTLANEIPGAIAGERGAGVTSGEDGVGPDDGFPGFPKGNHSVRLTNTAFGSVLTRLDVPGGVKREEGAVSFWIRRAPGAELDEVLWLAGEGIADQTRNPEHALIHTRLSSGGRVELCVENGDFDVLLSSNFSVADDQWHHIAASWGPSAVELFVDGSRVARADDFGKLGVGTMRGRYVRFGKPSEDLQVQGKRPFSGHVDEIAFWNRPLSGTEVARQFQAAKGDGDGPPK